MSEYLVQQTVHIAADRERIWEALTDRSQTKQYFFGCEILSMWGTGDAIVFKGKTPAGDGIEMTGTIFQIDPGKFLQYDLRNSEPQGEGNSHSVVSITLDDDDNGTTVSITDNVGEAEGAEERYKRSVDGWKKILQGLKQWVEKS